MCMQTAQTRLSSPYTYIYIKWAHRGEAGNSAQLVRHSLGTHAQLVRVPGHADTHTHARTHVAAGEEAVQMAQGIKALSTQA